MIRIDNQRCIACDTCVEYCPAEIIAPGPSIREEIHSYCVGCGHCAVACPSGAIEVVGFDDVVLPPYAGTLPVSFDQMATLLRRRRSIRIYKPDPVSRVHLEQLVEAASLVPTAHNWRSFRAYACTDRAVIRRIHQKLTDHYTKMLEVFKNPRS